LVFGKGSLIIASQLIAVPVLVLLLVLSEVTHSDRSDWTFTAAAGILGLLGCGVVAWFLLRRWRLPVSSLFTAHSSQLIAAAIAMDNARCLCVSHDYFGCLWSARRLLAVVQHGASEGKAADRGPPWFVALFVVLVGPPVEELLFQGVILRACLPGIQ
jgi:hypothetical protein